MLRSSIGARLVSVGSATLLIAGLFAQAAPALAASPVHTSPSAWGAASSGVHQVPGRTINLRTLAAQPAAKLPFDPAAASAALAKAVTPELISNPAIVGPPPPDLATTSGAPAAATPVAATGQTQAGSGNQTPPNSAIAVGPDEAMQAVNTSVEFTDRAGGDLVTDTLSSFFGLAERVGYTTFDAQPRVAFDALRQRWIASELSWDCATNAFPGDTAIFGHGYIDYAISNTADPLGSWTESSFLWQDSLPDLPSFGSSTDKFGLTASLFAMGPGGSSTTPGCIGGAFAGSEAIIQDWTQLKPGFGASTLHFQTRTYTTLDSVRIATQEPVVDASLRMIGIGNGTAAGNVTYINVTGSAVHGTVADQVVDLTALNVVPVFANPPSPAQSGGTLTAPVTGVPDGVIYSNGILAFAATYPCIPAGDSTTRDCVRVTTLANSNPAAQPTRLGDTLLGTNGFDSSFAGLAFSGNGVLATAYTESSSSTFASSYASYNRPSDSATAWSAPQLLTAGAATYTGAHWGAYTTVANDPQDPAAVWVGDPYANGSGGWSTTIHELNVGAGDGYVPVAPVRVLDTRSGRGLSGLFTANVPRTFAVAGVTVNSVTIPSNAVAITGNLTVTQQTGAGYVALTPTPTANPSSSTLNFPLGDDRANNVTIALSASGTLSAVYKATSGRHTQLILDVTGYFLAGSGQAYHPITTTRVLDTRTSHTTHLFHANVAQAFQVTNGGTIPADATAITANVTVTNQTKAGYVALTPTNNNNPTTSTLNFPLKDDRANGLTIPLAVSGKVSAVYKAATGATTNLIVDVTGYYSAAGGGLLFHPLNPGRRVDTRLAVGLSGFGNGLTGAQGTTSRSAVIAGHFGVPAAASAITGNLTITAQTGAGYVAVTNASVAHPTTSTINFPLGDDRANGVTVPLGAGDLWFVYQVLAGKHVQLILDLTGYFQ